MTASLSSGSLTPSYCLIACGHQTRVLLLPLLNFWVLE